MDGIDLEVRPGEIFGLLGPNGAGKTTTIGVCTTRVIATGGRVEVFGIDVAADPALAKRSIGVVTQYNTLDRSLTVVENLYYHARYFGVPRADARRQADELLDRFHLEDHAALLPDQLSGGLAQRLEVARAISHRPRILFLDEPTAGLDPQSRLALWDMVRDLREDGTTVLLTTHNMAEADELSDRVAIIDRGRILVLDTPGELKRNAGAETVIEIQAAPFPDPVLDTFRAVPGVDSVLVTGGGVRILASGREGVLPQVVQAANAHPIRDISVKEPTLETVFIELTGRALRE